MAQRHFFSSSVEITESHKDTFFSAVYSIEITKSHTITTFKLYYFYFSKVEIIELESGEVKSLPETNAFHKLFSIIKAGKDTIF